MYNMILYVYWSKFDINIYNSPMNVNVVVTQNNREEKPHVSNKEK